MLFASNECGLCSYTARFAFLSQALLCQWSGVVPVDLLRLPRCMPRRSWHLLGEHLHRWLVGQNTLGSWSYSQSACGSITSTNEPHAELPRPWGWGLCLQKLGHLQSQTVFGGSAVTKFWVYVLFFVQKRFLRRAEQICRMLSRCHKFFSAYDRTTVKEVWGCFQHRPYNSSKPKQPSGPLSWQVAALACSEHWQNELDQDIILPWWDLQTRVLWW